MLTDAEIRALKPAPKPYQRGDEKGLFLLVQPTGTLIWRFKYHFHGVERTLSFGHYPEMTPKWALARMGAEAGQRSSTDDPRRGARCPDT